MGCKTSCTHPRTATKVTYSGLLGSSEAEPGMRKVVIQMHMSLDGFADSRDGFVPIDDRDYWKAADRVIRGTAAAKVDALLLGRGTYQQFAGFWPRAATDPKLPKDMQESGRFLTDTPKFVFSKKLKRADWKNTTIVRGDLAREINRLKRKPGKNLAVLGGVAFPRALIARDLVDEYFLSVVPVVVGGGPDRLFPSMKRQRRLKLVRSWTFRNGVVLHHFLPVRD
jgi:dihydrofolate reductase